MDYNTSRKQLVLPEYGRNIQKMVDYIKTVEDKEKRTRLAHGIINIMAIMHQNTKDNSDLRRKLWDHLTIMSDFSLDVDSPYPLPTSFSLHEKPNKVPYQNERIRYMHYGRVTESLIKKACDLNDDEERDALIKILANHMKKLYVTWNRDIMSDEIIFDDIYTLSGGKIEVDREMKLVNTRDLMKPRRNKKIQNKQNKPKRYKRGKMRINK